ncbi:hypothetical protein ACJA23_02790 [Mycoplasma corogypsi]|uniref:hypothetical protein n=1 Tax=Mycoplasma corogypsi TaxID=2106 RepID=UPI003872FDCF
MHYNTDLLYNITKQLQVSQTTQSTVINRKYQTSVKVSENQDFSAEFESIDPKITVNLINVYANVNKVDLELKSQMKTSNNKVLLEVNGKSIGYMFGTNSKNIKFNILNLDLDKIKQIKVKIYSRIKTDSVIAYYQIDFSNFTKQKLVTHNPYVSYIVKLPLQYQFNFHTYTTHKPLIKFQEIKIETFHLSHGAKIAARVTQLLPRNFILNNHLKGNTHIYVRLEEILIDGKKNQKLETVDENVSGITSNSDSNTVLKDYSTNKYYFKYDYNLISNKDAINIVSETPISSFGSINYKNVTKSLSAIYKFDSAFFELLWYRNILEFNPSNQSTTNTNILSEIKIEQLPSDLIEAKFPKLKYQVQLPIDFKFNAEPIWELAWFIKRSNEIQV